MLPFFCMLQSSRVVQKKAESRCKARWMDRGSSFVWQKMATLGRSDWMHWKNLVREITWSGSQGRGFPLYQVLWDIDAESTNYLLVKDGEESVAEWLVALTWMWRLWQSINRLIYSNRLKQLFDYSFPELTQHCRCCFDIYFLCICLLWCFLWWLFKWLCNTGVECHFHMSVFHMFTISFFTVQMIEE